jgi:hypothetical protein
MLLAHDAAGDIVTRAWEGRTAVCIASGPSVTQAQIEQVRQARQRDDVRVIVVNDNYLIAPFADLLYWADDKWRQWHEKGIERAWPWCRFTADETRQAFHAFGGQRCTLTMWPAVDGCYRLRVQLPDGLSTDPTGVATGKTSGHQALNIAVLSGASTVLLVGYDGGRTDGRRHAFGEHPDRTEPLYQSQKMAARSATGLLETLGVRVVNCSPGTAIDAFECGVLGDELARVCADPIGAALPA